MAQENITTENERRSYERITSTTYTVERGTWIREPGDPGMQVGGDGDEGRGTRDEGRTSYFYECFSAYFEIEIAKYYFPSAGLSLGLRGNAEGTGYTAAMHHIRVFRSRSP